MTDIVLTCLCNFGIGVLSAFSQIPRKQVLIVHLSSQLPVTRITKRLLPTPLLILMRTSPHIHSERGRIPRLHEDRPRTGELAHQPFARADAGDDTPARHALQDVLAIPGYEVAVVDDVFLAFL